MPVKRASRKRRIIKTEPEEIVNGHRSDDTEGKCVLFLVCSTVINNSCKTC